MKKSNISLIVVLICLVVGTILCIQSIVGRDTAEDPLPEDSTTPPIETSVVPPEETPEPTSTPTPVPRPTSTPRPTPTPTPAPTPTPVQSEASGSFRSDTGTGLNIQVDWRAYPSADAGYRLDVDVSVLSYSFYTDALFDSIELDVGGSKAYQSSPKVSYDGKELAVTPLATYSTYTNAVSCTVPITATWNYKGSYSGVELERISASGSAQLP